MTGISGLTKNVVMQLKWETPYESICYKERPEPQQKNIIMLKEMKNKYVEERRYSLKKACYMVWKKNVDKMKVENTFSMGFQPRTNIRQDGTGNLVDGE